MLLVNTKLAFDHRIFLDTKISAEDYRIMLQSKLPKDFILGVFDCRVDMREDNMKENLYEVLIINTELEGFSAKRGQIADVMLKGHSWSLKEKTSRFAIIEVFATKEMAGELIRDYTYDFDKSKFINKEYGFDFDGSIILSEEEIEPHNNTDIIEIAEQINPNWKQENSDVCLFLQPKHCPQTKGGNYSETRKYWFKKLMNFKDYNGIKRFLVYIKHRDHGEIAKAARKLPEETIQKLLNEVNIFNQEDITWMKWCWFRRP